MAFTMAEGLVEEVIAYFTANMGTKLTIQNAELGAPALAAPVATYRGLTSLDLVSAYPALFVASPRTVVAPLPSSGGQASTNKPELVIGVLVLDANEENLQIRLYRYARAIVELLLEGVVAGEITWNLVTDPEWEVDTAPGGKLSELIRTEIDDFVGEVAVTIPQANKIETK